MAETKQFEENVAKAKAIKNPLMLTLREYPKSVAQLIGLTLLVVPQLVAGLAVARPSYIEDAIGR